MYIARTTPPDLVYNSLLLCDIDIRESFSAVAALQLTDPAWLQAQLSLSMSGVGLRSTARHCTSAYISSHTAAMPGKLTAALRTALTLHAEFTQSDGPLPDDLIADWLDKPPSQKTLSHKLEKLDSDRLLHADDLTDVNRIRLMSVSAPHASAWLRALPCKCPIDLTLNSMEMQVSLQHRLGLRLAGPGDCPTCAHHTLLDAAGHHHLTCSTGGSVTSRHNRIRDGLHSLCRHAGMAKTTPGIHGGWKRGDVPFSRPFLIKLEPKMTKSLLLVDLLLARF